jgi:hypothetical protein
MTKQELYERAKRQQAASRSGRGAGFTSPTPDSTGVSLILRLLR